MVASLSSAELGTAQPQLVCQYYRKSVDEAPHLAFVTFCNKLVSNNLSLLLSARLHYICLVYPDILRRKEILLLNKYHYNK